MIVTWTDEKVCSTQKPSRRGIITQSGYPCPHFLRSPLYPMDQRQGLRDLNKPSSLHTGNLGTNSIWFPMRSLPKPTHKLQGVSMYTCACRISLLSMLKFWPLGLNSKKRHHLGLAVSPSCLGCVEEPFLSFCPHPHPSL